jgi:sugar-specific transcriptional regulator TrmB
MFQDFGLSLYEDRAVEALLRERMTARELLKRTPIPPGKLYSVLKTLEKRGIITSSSTRPKSFAIENPAKTISKLIEEKQQRDEETIAKARQAISALPRERSIDYFFRVGVTPEDNKEMQLKMFTDAKREVCQVLNSRHKPSMNRRSKDLWEEAIKEAVGRGVHFRALYHESTRIPSSILSLPKNRFEIRRTDKEMERLDIVDGKRVMLKIISDDPLLFGGVISVENERLAKNLQAIFEDLWKRSAIEKGRS